MTGVTGEGVDVLLAEDDYDLSDAMNDVLEMGGYRIKTVCNGLEALSWLQETSLPPALILLDLMMPVMDGWQFRKAQLEDPRLSSIPVAVLSARGDVSLDGIPCLKKPLRAKELLAFVARYCVPKAG